MNSYKPFAVKKMNDFGKIRYCFGIVFGPHDLLPKRGEKFRVKSMNVEHLFEVDYCHTTKCLGELEESTGQVLVRRLPEVWVYIKGDLPQGFKLEEWKKAKNSQTTSLQA